LAERALDACEKARLDPSALAPPGMTRSFARMGDELRIDRSEMQRAMPSQRSECDARK